MCLQEDIGVLFSMQRSRVPREKGPGYFRYRNSVAEYHQSLTDLVRNTESRPRLSKVRIKSNSLQATIISNQYQAHKLSIIGRDRLGE